MRSIGESMAQAGDEAGPLGLPAWKTWVSAGSAVLLGVAFIIAGVWKITDPIAASVRLVQAQVPAALGLPAAIGFGIAETLAGVLLLAPRLRRWGAWLTAALLVAFMVYIALFYNVLRGQECNCFPWIERAVGPAFFIGDAVMLLMAGLAGWWAGPARGLRSAAIVFAAVCVFAGVSYGVVAARGAAVIAPEFVTVDGQPFPLREGRVFLYFFNPECLHCATVAGELGRLDWGHTRLVAVATQMPEFGREFLVSSGLPAALTADVDVLKEVFSFVDVPFGVAVESGRQRSAFISFDGAPEALRKLGFVR